jgi:phosphate starvation-inducible PhoH-like protein
LTEITIPLRSHEEAIQVLGPYDRYAKLLRQALDIEIYARGGNLRLKGKDHSIGEAQRRLEHLLGKLRKGRELDARTIEEILVGVPEKGEEKSRAAFVHPPEGTERPVQAGASRHRGRETRLAVRPRAIEPRSASQRRYLDSIEENTLTFGCGVAGTGKTFIAVAAAVRRLRSGSCRRLVITRPVVEAGENLGFLPGDLQAKLNPYMRPVYDALFEMIGFEEATRLEEAGVLEIAPLAYMRGRTLANAFVLLDEAQNTSVSQMKMFLTRLGEGSCMVVTGDPTQTDLHSGQKSGLNDAVRRLRGHAGIGVVEFSVKDIVRHPLVEQIVRAYESSSEVGQAEERNPAR